MLPSHPRSTLFPYTTLFRSSLLARLICRRRIRWCGHLCDRTCTTTTACALGLCHANCNVCSLCWGGLIVLLIDHRTRGSCYATVGLAHTISYCRSPGTHCVLGSP